MLTSIKDISRKEISDWRIIPNISLTAKDHVETLGIS